MRPTDLGFRSPKEKTPDAYYPQVTSNGKCLGFSRRNIHESFSTSRRFQQYDIDARRTGYRIGPGSYDSSFLATKSVRGGPVYKAFHGGKDVSNNGYYYIGNQLMFDPAFVLKSRRTSLINQETQIEYSKSIDIKRPISAKPREGSKSSLNTPVTKKPRPASARQQIKSPYLANIMT